MKLIPGENEDYWENPEIKKRNQDWIRRWPNYCTKCGGWGGDDRFGFGYPYHLDGICQPEDKCHRCGGDLDGVEDYRDWIPWIPPGGTLLDPLLPICTKCGWRYDDGLEDL